jgi:hypothetical protein
VHGSKLYYALRTALYFFTMNRWVRRLVYTSITLVWLFIMMLPAFAFLLAARGQLQFGSDPQNQVRFFLLQQADAEGVGIEWTRPMRQHDNCTQTTVRYLVWAGEGEAVDTCRCYTNDGQILPVEQSVCEQ